VEGFWRWREPDALRFPLVMRSKHRSSRAAIVVTLCTDPAARIANWTSFAGCGSGRIMRIGAFILTVGPPAVGSVTASSSRHLDPFT
jgi:hypothetical protein